MIRSLHFRAPFAALVCCCFFAFKCQPADTPAQPNVILIITDDQGYGEIAAHGNTMIQTPHLDRLHDESVRLTNFHVDPTCSPTRSALMTGRYSTRTGVWHTIMGRSLMNTEEQTLAEVFRHNGYRTGMLGKWHLGDNFPLRPQDQGFDDVLWLKGGGVGQGPDYWGNDYFDDTYWRGNTQEVFEGYCTDVWFQEAAAFIEKNSANPFFLYLATNAAHGPFLVDEKYSKPYTDQGVPAPMDAFYGMITNLDENIGRLRQTLETLGIAENTLLIFMTDNGTAVELAEDVEAPWTGFNAGMRGIKGSKYEGGHRVPFFVYWPAKGLSSGRDVDQLAAHIDVMPTLVDLLGLEKPAGPSVDGASLKDALLGDNNALRDRTLFVHSQRIEYPEKWRQSAVMTERWRLVDQHELYDVQADPAQTRDVAEVNPDVVAGLQSAYETWWGSLEPVFDDYVRISVGDPAENPVHLMSHDWHTNDAAVPWHQRHVEQGLISNGYWAIDVATAGNYAVTLFRWPDMEKKAMQATHAKIQMGDVEAAQPIDKLATKASFELNLSPGPVMLQTWLTNEQGVTYGAYFVEVRKL